MNKYLLLFGCGLALTALTALPGIAQTIAYFGPIRQADSLARLKQYKQAAACYDRALSAGGEKTKRYDRYNAACIYALAGEKEKAFRTLDRLAHDPHFYKGSELLADRDLVSLHQDPRWATFRAIVQHKDSLASTRINRPLKEELDSMFDKDQRYRRQVDSVHRRYGDDSPQMDQLEEKMAVADSENLVQLIVILDRYGWPTHEMAGSKGVSAAWAILQHADNHIELQEKYLPMLRRAVTAGEADAGELAMLQDRILVNRKRPQLYGTQVHRNEQGVWQPLPVWDPARVDSRRAAMGLEPLRFYLMEFQ